MCFRALWFYGVGVLGFWDFRVWGFRALGFRVYIFKDCQRKCRGYMRRSGVTFSFRALELAEFRA